MGDDSKRSKGNGISNKPETTDPTATPADEANGKASRWADMTEDIALDPIALDSPSGAAESAKDTLDDKKEEREEKKTLPDEPDIDLDSLFPRPASTVVLLRPKDGVPFEVFLVRRHHKSGFMANAYVYPGGTVDSTDTELTQASHTRGLQTEDMSQRLGVAHPKLARGLYIAAIREVFEEAGALLATEGDGKPINFANPVERDRYETYREVLVEGEVDFDQVVGWEDLQLRVDQLTFFAHWITPPIEKRRYDTYFFLARAPEDQELSHDDTETTDSKWMTPPEALAAYDNGTIQLTPPTLMTLKQLSQLHSIDQALAHFADRPIPTITPHPVVEGKQVTLLLPGDPDYPEPVELGVEGPTRIVLEQGRWWAVESPDSDTTVH